MNSTATGAGDGSGSVEARGTVTPVFQVLTSLVVALLGLGLGATLTIETVKKTIKKPLPVFIGFFSQFGLMPLIAFALYSIFAMDELTALGVLLIGCSPGGSTSNLFTFWTKGNVALSIFMTVCSTVLSFGMIPLLVFLYTLGFEDDSIGIPFENIAISLALVLVPSAIGIFIRHKWERVAKWFEIGASVVGLLFIGAALVVGIVQNLDLFSSPASVWVSAALMEIVGIAFGYAVAWLARLSPAKRRTIAFETGVQNSTLTIAIVVFSFSDDIDKLNKVIVFPLFYSLFLVINSIVFVVYFRFVMPRFCTLETDDDEDDDADDASKDKGKEQGSDKYEDSLGKSYDEDDIASGSHARSYSISA